MKQPGQRSSETLSYERPAPPDGAGKPSPASQPDCPATCVLPDCIVEGGQPQDDASARERPPQTDPSAGGAAPQAPTSLTPPAAGAPSPTIELAPGAFHAGEQVDHFEIISLIGRGGMGCVYKAFDRDLGRTVAIKTLHGIDQHQPHTLARFRREAQAASRVVHPNLVIIHAYGTHGDTPYIVMEYLSGCSLAAEIAQRPLSIERTADVLVAACAGVYAAHRANVVHRDLKPANIFLAHTPMGETPKILDFGISRIGDDNASLTGTGDIVGTTYYLAPEQAAGRGVDARADQYALGVILYECLTGVLPFTGSAVYTIVRNIVEGIFEPPSRARPEIPRDLEAVVLRAMSRTPDDRFAHVRDLGLALMPFMSAQGRQQWSYHFTAPEAGMPIAPSLAVPASPGGETQTTPAEAAGAQSPEPAAAPTKILPVGQSDRWHAVAAHPTPAAISVPEFATATAEVRPIVGRGRMVIAAAAAIALLALAAWVLWGSGVRDAARSGSSTATAAPVTPPLAAPASPVAPAPAPPEPPPTRAAPSLPANNSTKPTEGHDRAARKKNTSKAGQPREAGEPSETMGGTSKRGADHTPAAAKW